MRDRLKETGFDWIWFLSVWQTGCAGQRLSHANAEWRREFRDTLPELRAEDLAGSGFAAIQAETPPFESRLEDAILFTQNAMMSCYSWGWAPDRV